jgi:hypothetical protein
MKFKIPSYNIKNTTKALVVVVLSASSIFSSEISRGVNDVLNIESNAKIGAMAGIQGPQDYWYTAESMELSFSHLSWIAESQLDELAFVLPLKSKTNALAFSLSRFGQDDIPLIDEDEVVNGSEYRTFSIAEYILEATYVHQWDWFRLGGSLFLLHRDIGQQGIGVRGDLHGQLYYKNFVFSTRAEALTSSISQWESDHFEYEEPEVFIGMSFKQAIPYFYGDLRFLWESKGLFREESAQRTGNLEDPRLFYSPLNFLKFSALGLEYSGEHGLAIRAGLPVIKEVKYPSFGAGYTLKEALSLDYSINKHPELGVFHRFSISFREEFINWFK